MTIIIEEYKKHTIHEICEKVKDFPGTIFFDSSNKRGQEYNYIACLPYKILNNKDVLKKLRDEINTMQLEDSAIPFIGGAAGFFSYEFAEQIEKTDVQIKSRLKTPVAYIGFYDLVIAERLSDKKTFLISNGRPELEPKNQYLRAKKRLLELKRYINLDVITDCMTPHMLQVSQNFDRKEYKKIVKSAKEFILNGDIFEVNTSLSIFGNISYGCRFKLYNKLRNNNPAPFSSYINLGDNQFILCTSPEKFWSKVKNRISCSPIKGTIKRESCYEQDQINQKILKNSDKDKAENIMIVDLLRNDLSKVCKIHSIKTPKLCELQSFENVHHLVSQVDGELKDELDTIDLIEATFPCGSITGAPKLSSRKIISSLEKVDRGPYCGSIGYISFSNNACFNVAIRTMTVIQDKFFVGAGGAVTLDSNENDEYNECMTKINNILKALRKDETCTHN